MRTVSRMTQGLSEKGSSLYVTSVTSERACVCTVTSTSLLAVKGSKLLGPKRCQMQLLVTIRAAEDSAGLKRSKDKCVFR